jgi:ABC-type uncharacterized transport system substrate-binding protein
VTTIKSVKIFIIIVLVGTPLIKLSASQVVKFSSLIVSSYHQELEAERGLVMALQKGMSSISNSTVLYMDTKRRTPNSFKEISLSIQNKILENKPDIVFLCDDNALKYLGDFLANKDVPTVFLGINGNPREYLGENHHKLSGVLERGLYLRGILQLKQFFPKVKKISILIDNSLTAQSISQEMFKAQKSKKIKGISFTSKTLLTFDSFKQAIKDANQLSDTQLIIGPMHALQGKEPGSNIHYKTALKWASTHYKKPIFTFWKDFIGHDFLLGGYVIDVAKQGEIAAEMGQKILSKKPLGPQIVTPKTGVFVFSQKQLLKWKIDTSKIFKEKIELIE